MLLHWDRWNVPVGIENGEVEMKKKTAILIVALVAVLGGAVVYQERVMAEQQEPEQAEAEALENGLVIDLYGQRYMVLDMAVDGTNLNWKHLASYIPAELLDENNPKMRAVDLGPMLMQMVGPYAAKYQEGVDSLTKMIAEKYPDRNHGNLDLEVAETFLGNHAVKFYLAYPEFKEEILEVDKASKTYASILLLQEIVESNINFKRSWLEKRQNKIK